MPKLTKEEGRKARHNRVRKKVKGTTERPRLSIFRSTRNIYAQIIDDEKSHTVLGISTLSSEVKELIRDGGNIEGAKVLGRVLAQKALEKNVKAVVFDRGGYKFHGRVAALAASARENGLQF
jgi:large subunit ribosomal protein L18